MDPSDPAYPYRRPANAQHMQAVMPSSGIDDSLGSSESKGAPLQTPVQQSTLVYVGGVDVEAVGEGDEGGKDKPGTNDSQTTSEGLGSDDTGAQIPIQSGDNERPRQEPKQGDGAGIYTSSEHEGGIPVVISGNGNDTRNEIIFAPTLDSADWWVYYYNQINKLFSNEGLSSDVREYILKMFWFKDA